MSYVAWSVVFGEQPTAAKWNILGDNDASFHDGTGIDDDVILERHIATGAVTDNKTGFTNTYSIVDYSNGTANYSSNSTSLAAVDGTNLAPVLNIKVGRLVRVDVYLTGVWNTNIGYAITIDIQKSGGGTSTSGARSISPAGYNGNWTTDGNSRGSWQGTFYFTGVATGNQTFTLMWATSNVAVTAYLGQYARQNIVVTEIL